MKRHSTIILSSALALAGATVTAQQSAPKPASGAGIVRAHADIKGEGITGTADFVETQQGAGKIVNITIAISGLKPGMHGVHLHAVGKCDPDFTAAGGHFDPGPAGNPDPDANHPYHMGDIPQISAAANGKATAKVATTRVTLSDGPLSLFDSDGSAIIIHANPDQGITGEPKSGVSGGPRVACGVIEKK
ncbi:MAG TPA: superoxide dismutase family protein [Vicinamibacterales bacterium]|nr:superoxide dismutase family protein [Vicinamibacterales bacterium]